MVTNDIIVQGKGGVGKTVTAQLLVTASDASGVPRTLLEFDTKQKLRHFYPDRVTSYMAGADIDEIQRNPTAAISYFDPAAEALAEGGALIDLGANVDVPFFSWMRKSEVADVLAETGATVRWWIVCTAEPGGFDGVSFALDQIAALMPSSERVVVLNEEKGKFGSYGAEQAALKKRKQAGENIQLVRLDKCVSEAWIDVEKAGIPLGDAVLMEPAEYVSRFGLKLLPARRARGAIAAFVQDHRAAWAGLVP